MMKLGLGQILVRKSDRSRWQVVSIGPQVQLRRMVLSDTGGSHMEWLAPMHADADDFESIHRAHVDVLYEPGDEQRA